MNNIYNRLYDSRFEIYLILQLIFLFGSLVVPPLIFDTLILPILYILSGLSGILVVSKSKKSLWFCILIFASSMIAFGGDMFLRENSQSEYTFLRLLIYFAITVVVTWSIIKQVWNEKTVDRKVILGLVCGYISLGFLGFFIFMSIDLTHSGAFTGDLINTASLQLRSQGILYYSFITLLTIGYGEIVPAIPLAQKAAVLLGLMGQIYIVVITAVVVGKYIKSND